MSINRPLMPGFLKKAEQKLLLNSPGIWSTRVHLVLYYGGLFILALATLCFLEPKDVRDKTSTEYWIGFVSIISVIGLTVWLIYLLRFNVFKKYGNIKPLHGFVSFILYFIATGVIVLFTYVHPVVESIRANFVYDDEELVRDINDINLKIGQLEYPLFQTAWKYDTVTLIKDENAITPDPSYYANYNDLSRVKEKPHFFRVDSSAFNNRMEVTDSLIKMNNTTYLMYNTPPFDFVSGYGADDNTKTKILTAFQLFHKIYRQPPAKAAREKISKELKALLHKYRYPEIQEWDGEAEIVHDGPYEKVYDKYRLTYINSSISHIVTKKYRWKSSRLPEAVRIFYYITLGITLLIFIFRHSTVRTFFLSLLTGVLLIIFSALLFSFSHFEETAVYAMLVIYTLLFFFFSLATWANKKRFAITGIGINLFVFIITFIPLEIVGWCRAIARDRHHDNEAIPFDDSSWDNYLMLAEFGGALLLLVLLATYIHKVYRRWYSLPEN